MESKIQLRLDREKLDNETPGEGFYAQPLEESKFKWHFTLRGVEGTCYEGGLYHGLLDLGDKYPLAPPNIYFLNDSGRYQANVKICLNITSYHKESWSPIWNVRKMMEALTAYFVCDEGGIGSLVESDAKRRKIAKTSRDFECPQCGPIVGIDKIIKEGKPAKLEKPPAKKEAPKDAEEPKPLAKGKRVKNK
jgi:ubiquitin-conjugating enzyme E2 J1